MNTTEQSFEMVIIAIIDGAIVIVTIGASTTTSIIDASVIRQCHSHQKLP